MATSVGSAVFWKGATVVARSRGGFAEIATVMTVFTHSHGRKQAVAKHILPDHRIDSPGERL
jgi:hypothetical protein